MESFLNSLVFWLQQYALRIYEDGGILYAEIPLDCLDKLCELQDQEIYKIYMSGYQCSLDLNQIIELYEISSDLFIREVSLFTAIPLEVSSYSHYQEQNKLF